MVLRLLVLALVPSCIAAQGTIGARTPVAGELDKGPQTRFEGGVAEGTGMVFPGGGVAGGILVEHVAAGEHHAAFGGWGLGTIAVHPNVHAFARLSYSKAVTSDDVACPPKECASQFGLQIGAHLVKVREPQTNSDDEVEDMPMIGGGGLALTYTRADLDGATGHYIGLQVSFIITGALTSSKQRSY